MADPVEEPTDPYAEIATTPSGRHKVVDAHTANVLIAKAADSWPGVVRAIAASAGAVALGWHSPNDVKYALGVLLLVASPSLARAVVAPLLAYLLKR